MNRTIISFASLFLLTLFSGCFYHPHSSDIPLISEKGEVRVDGGISLIPTAHATISYGLTNKIAIQAYASKGNDKNNYLQASTGIYKKFNANEVLETYVGYGNGNSYDFSTITGGKLFGSYQLYFGQFNYGKIRDENSKIEYALSIKAGYLTANLTANNYFEPPTSNFELKDNNLLVEPSGLIRFGGNKFKLGLKLGYNYLYKFNNQDLYIPYSRFNFGLGLNYNFK